MTKLKGRLTTGDFLADLRSLMSEKFEIELEYTVQMTTFTVKNGMHLVEKLKGPKLSQATHTAIIFLTESGESPERSIELSKGPNHWATTVFHLNSRSGIFFEQQENCYYLLSEGYECHGIRLDFTDRRNGSLIAAEISEIDDLLEKKGISPPGFLVDSLVQRGAKGIVHSNRNLLAHLCRTYCILRLWGCSETVCLAGLFHSVYGVGYEGIFSRQKRSEVKSLIGDSAELLVFEFCKSSKERRLSLNSASDREALVVIDLANCIEVAGNKAFSVEKWNQDSCFFRNSINLLPQNQQERVRRIY